MSSVELRSGKLIYDVSYTTQQHEIHEYTVTDPADMPTVLDCFELISEQMNHEEAKRRVDDLIAGSTVVYAPDGLTRLIIIWEGGK